MLEHLIYSADIVALQESRITDGEFRVAGFNNFYNRRHLGLVTLVRDSFLTSEVDVSQRDSDEIQLLAIKVQANGPFVLVNVYACNGKVDSQKWLCLSEILSHLEETVIFCGNYNAKGKLWGNTSTNKQDEDLEVVLQTIDLICINSGDITRMAS